MPYGFSALFIFTKKLEKVAISDALEVEAATPPVVFGFYHEVNPTRSISPYYNNTTHMQHEKENKIHT